MADILNIKRLVGRYMPNLAVANTLGNSISLDEEGRVYRRGDEVFRAVVPPLHERYRRLKASGHLQELFAAGLVKTWEAGAEGEHVLGHERVPFVTYPQEWTLPMLRDAALCILDMAILLHKADLRLQDAHPWNVTFRFGKAVYLDFSSIVEGTDLPEWWIAEFFSCCYVPLWLRSKRLGTAARIVNAQEHPLGGRMAPRSALRYLFHRRALGRLCTKFWAIARRYGRRHNSLSLLQALRDHVSSLHFPKARSEWTAYDEPGGDYADPSSFTPKALAVQKLLSQLPPGPLIDFACNKGWFTGLATTMGHSALGIDIDDNAVEAARQTRAGRWKFDVACMNLLWPTPPQGRFLSWPSSIERWRCDTVLMIALAHHLVLRQRVRFEALAHIAMSYGAKNLIIEWVPREDVHVRTWFTKIGVDFPDWYNEEKFVAALSTAFPTHSRVQSGVGSQQVHGPESRIMYLFRR